MKILPLIIILFLNFGFLNLHAQIKNPIQIQVIMPQPIPKTTIDLLDKMDNPILVLTNKSVINQSIMLKISLDGANGITALIDPFTKKPAHSIDFTPGESKVLTPRDFDGIFSNYGGSDIIYTGINYKEFIQSQIIPEGNYSICIQAFDYQTGINLSGNYPSGCSGSLIIRTPEPPRWISPYQNQAISITGFSPVILRWTQVIVPSTQVRYKVKIVKINNQINPYDAIDNLNFLYYEEDGLDASLLICDASKIIFPDGIYAAQITAYSEDGKLFLKNDGKSDLRIFRTVQNKLTPAEITNIQNNQEINISSEYTFSWSAILNTNVDVLYDFTICLVPDGIQAEEAIQNPNNIIHQEKNLDARSFLYNANFPALNINQRYAIQVKTFDPLGELPFKNGGFSTVKTFTIKQQIYPAPVITAPTANQIYTDQREYDFAWTQQTPTDAGIKYRLKLWKMPSNVQNIVNMTVANNWIINNPPTLEINDISTKTKKITETEGIYIDETYLVQVTAYEPTTNMVFGNDGISELVIFKTRSVNYNPTFQCGVLSLASLPSDQTPVQISLQSSDTIQMGLYRIKIQQVQWNNSRFNGTGKIVAGNFFKSPILVHLNNIQINRGKRVVAGSATADFSNQVSIPSSWKSFDGNFTENASIGQYYDNISIRAKSVDRISTSVTLPLRYDNMYITAMILSPTAMTANMISIERLAGDANAGEKYLLFGLKNINFNPAGPTFTDGQGKLPLINNVLFTENQNISYTLSKDSSYLPFNCVGSQMIHISGIVKMTDTKFIVGSGNITGSTISTNFQTNFDNWNNWMANIAFMPNYILKMSQLQNHVFEPVEAIIDHSVSENPSTINLPTGAYSSSNSWKGVYFTKMNVSLPEYIKSTDRSRISKSVNNTFVFDQNGFTGRYHTVLISDRIIKSSIGNWDADLKSITLQFIASSLWKSKIGGSIKIPVFTNAASFNLDISWNGFVNSQLLSFADIQNVEFVMPMWHSKVSLSSNSQIQMALLNNNTDVHLTAIMNGSLKIENTINEAGGLNINNIGFTGFVVRNFRDANNPYLDISTLNLPSASNLKIANYPITARSIQVTSVSNTVSRLTIGFNFNLDGLSTGISASSQLRIDGEYNTRNHIWTYKTASITPINIPSIDIPGIAGIRGSLTYSNMDGNSGFTGNLSANLLQGLMDGSLAAVFGSTEGGNKYWGFMADAQYSSVTAPLIWGFRLRGIGGGAYYNMRKVDTEVDNRLVRTINTNNNNPLRDFYFEPYPYNTFGVYAKVALSTPDEYTFNGRFSLACNLRNGMVQSIELGGEANLMNEVSVSTSTSPELQKGEINITGDMSYNFPNSRFTGIFGYDINMDLEVGTLKGKKSDAVDILFTSNNWHFNVGTIDNPNPLNLIIEDNTFRSSSYINLSNNGFTFGAGINYNKNFYYNPGSYNPASWWYDHYKLNLHASVNIDGQISKTNPLCSNHPTGEYFFYLGGGLNFGYRFYGRDDDDNGWYRLSSGGVGVNTKLYFPNPSGFYFGVNSSSLGNPHFTIGQGCN